MKSNVCRYMTVLLGATVLLGGCQNSGTQDSREREALEKLGQIQVITRESGSGTRSSLAQALGLDEEGVDDRDHITDTAQVAASGEEMIGAVARSEGALGYVSLGTGENEDSEVRALAVDGVSPDAAAIESGEYPLSRTLCLASQDDGNALKEDFLTFVTGKGQETVEKFLVPAADGKDVFLSGQPSGTLRIHGSTSLAPLMEALAEEYEEINPAAEIEVEASDSTQGITDTLTGACDMAMVSRELYAYEADLLTAVPVAKDGIRILVHADNPLEGISMDALKGIYSGDITEWAETNEK